MRLPTLGEDDDETEPLQVPTIKTSFTKQNNNNHVDRELKQKEVRAYERIAGQKHETSSSDYDSDVDGKKRPVKYDENGNPIVRKKKGIVGELGIDKGIKMFQKVTEKIADFNPLMNKKSPKRRGDQLVPNQEEGKQH